MSALSGPHDSDREWAPELSTPSFDCDSVAKPNPGSHDATLLGLAQRLPHELLAEIFLIGLNKLNAKYQSCAAVNIYLARLTAVCASWRSIAILTPMLWSKIHCVEYSAHNISNRAAFAKLQLERSANVLLDLELTPGFPPDIVSTAKMIIILYPHLHRCRTITLGFQSEGDPEALLPLPGPLKHLTSLTILDTHGSFHERTIITDTETPILRHLEYTGRLTALRALRTGSLNHIRLHGVTLGDAMGFLSKCPAAQSVMIAPRLKNSDVYPKPFTLNDLTTVGIPRRLFTVFQHIVKTPRLEELCLFSLNNIVSLPGLSGSQVPPLQSLERLTLLNTRLLRCSGRLYDFMASHPGIEQLTLYHCCDPIVISAMLVNPDKGRAYWPLLRRLQLPEDHEPLLPSLRMLRFEHTQGRLTANKLLGACMIDLLEARPALSFAASKHSFGDSEVSLGEVEARFRHRFVKTPYEQPISMP